MASDPTRGRLEIAAVDTGEDETCQTFVMHGEDHTLGNTLRYMIMKNPEVKFCGYSIPHPSEHKINFRIQTRDAVAVDVLRQGFSELTALCEHALNTFETSVDKFKSSQEQKMDTVS